MIPKTWLGRILSLWDDLRSSYWFVPLLMSIAASISAVILLDMDRRHEPSLGEFFGPFSLSSEATRSVLSTITGSVITVTGVVFSITVVALTLASSQFGPRLLRGFLRDRSNQFVLGTFVSTFLFSLIVLRGVKNDYLPILASTVAVLLAVGSVFVLIYFIHHVTTSIQAPSVIANVGRELVSAVERFTSDEPAQVRPGTQDASDGETPGAESESASIGRAPIEHAPAGRNASGGGQRGGHGGGDDDQAVGRTGAQKHRGATVRSRSAGFLRVIDRSGLVDLAEEHDFFLEIVVRPGEFVPLDRVLAVVGDPVTDAVLDDIRGAFVLGDRRTEIQDPGLLVDQLVEMGVRALSPGVNDPHTAIQCLGRLGDGLGRLGARYWPAFRHADEDGRVRVIEPRTEFAAFAWRAFAPFRQYGSGDPTVVVALVEAAGLAAARCIRDADRDALREVVDETLAAALAKTSMSSSDRSHIEDAREQFEFRLQAERSLP
ncbi:MAG: DUF2254 domain-containing protein [Candidatus Eisenbacteria bacterium]